MAIATPFLKPVGSTTDRLQLREFQLEDAAEIFILNSNPEMTKYQSWNPLKEEEQAVRWVQGAIREQFETPRTSFSLVVTSKPDGTFVGNIGAEIDYKTSTTEIWYSMCPGFHGKGYATEAVRALIALLPTNHTLAIECDPKNIPSRKLADRLGFSQVYYEERAYESKGQWVGCVRYIKEQDKHNLNS